MSELQGRQRLDDIPPVLRWLIVSIKEIGFPIVVAIYMGYVAIEYIPKMAASLDANTKAMTALTEQVQHHTRQSERALRRILGDRYPEDP